MNCQRWRANPNSLATIDVDRKDNLCLYYLLSAPSLETSSLHNIRYGIKAWHVDETYVSVHGKWCYLYRAIDWDGNLVDSMLSEKRDMAAAKRFFKQAIDVVGHAPEQVTAHGHNSYPRAIRETLENEVIHHSNHYLNNRIEQDHRGIKQRYYPMRGFGNVESAARFCRAFDE